MDIAGLAYLQYQQRAKINWDKLQSVSQGAISNLATATTQISDNIGGHDHTSAIAMANFGIPLESLEMMTAKCNDCAKEQDKGSFFESLSKDCSM